VGNGRVVVSEPDPAAHSSRRRGGSGAPRPQRPCAQAPLAQPRHRQAQRRRRPVRGGSGGRRDRRVATAPTASRRRCGRHRCRFRRAQVGARGRHPGRTGARRQDDRRSDRPRGSRRPTARPPVCPLTADDSHRPCPPTADGTARRRPGAGGHAGPHGGHVQRDRHQLPGSRRGDGIRPGPRGDRGRGRSAGRTDHRVRLHRRRPHLGPLRPVDLGTRRTHPRCPDADLPRRRPLLSGGRQRAGGATGRRRRMANRLRLHRRTDPAYAPPCRQLQRSGRTRQHVRLPHPHRPHVAVGPQPAHRRGLDGHPGHPPPRPRHPAVGTG